MGVFLGLGRRLVGFNHDRAEERNTDRPLHLGRLDLGADRRNHSGDYQAIPPVVPVAPESDPNIAKWLDAVETGNLPIIRPAGIMPVDGESFVYEQRGQYGQTYSQRITRGGSPALYVPLGRGFRARVGGYQGRSQNVTNFAWGPMGTVFVSNLRIIFKTDGRPDVAVAPYNKIVAYETYPNGLGLQVDGVGMMQFRTGDVILGLLFKKIVEQRFAAASTAQGSCVGGSPLG
jgi:hypothetical protein